ncbi:PTS glucose transporter subunit IIA [Lactobacillus sp. ESL0791]|uniref:PTS sugar transporter subunit IIA n=1 Tax=Lactobacillus sp. ESL0791 TaxID=2983234 RepID=UPI0023F8079A|nr:PTS glucose transporter subunit IIA [Lactobacillus sp. ESL0791]MDF7639360.1 PTS glucose transporter subunit IIA [Lactobacillus sp. ESL0791]
MFKLFKKQSKFEKLVSPVRGRLIPITDVSDQMFAGKVMGDGFAIVPNDDQIYSPVSGEIKSIFKTKHAITIETTAGLEVLLHFGVDTVELKGAPFKLAVEEGQKIEPDTFIGTMDRAMVIANKKSTEIIVVFTNMDKIKELPLIEPQEIKHGTEIGNIQLN